MKLKSIRSGPPGIPAGQAGATKDHPDLVIELLLAVYMHNTKRGRLWFKYWANVVDLRLGSWASNATLYADRAGLLRRDSELATSVMLTAKGYDLLKSRGLA
jgi:hypothetical protein